MASDEVGVELGIETVERCKETLELAEERQASLVDPYHTRRAGLATLPGCFILLLYVMIVHTYVNSNIVEINKEAGGGAQGTLSLSKNCTSRESVSPLSRLIRGFRNKYH